MLKIPSYWLCLLWYVFISFTLVWLYGRWWCQRLWHSRSLLRLCPIVTFTPHMVLPTCRYSKKLGLSCPSCPVKCPAEGDVSHTNCSCCMSGLLYLLGMVSLAAVETYTLWSSSAVAPETCPSPWAMHRAGLSLGGSQELSLDLSRGPGPAGTDHAFTRRQTASQRSKVFDLKGMLSIGYRCLEPRKASKGCLTFPGESLL